MKYGIEKLRVYHLSPFNRVSFNTPLSREMIRLLKMPVDLYNNALRILRITNFEPLMRRLDYTGARKTLAAHILSNIVEHDTSIPGVEEAEGILGLLLPLLADQSDEDSSKTSDDGDLRG